MVSVSVFSYFLPKGKKFASGKKKAFSILAKIFALLLLTFKQGVDEGVLQRAVKTPYSLGVLL
jgi:hypothetical protein